ncbi:MAG: TetR/AcrR family transcriptional regulator [Mycobacteriales bacterium]
MEEPRPASARGAERRQAIVRAALDVFSRRGFRNGSLAEVAEQVGIGAPAILYHFGSKENLLVEVLRERDRRAGELVAEIPVDGGVPSLLAVVQFAEMSEREPGLVSLHTVLQCESFETDAPAHRYFLRRSRVLRMWFVEVLDAAAARQEVKAGLDHEAIARRTVALMEGAAMLWLTDPTVSLVELYRDFLADLVREVALPGSG